jgi:hypothetical protein
MITAMTYPSATVAPVVYTDFINGVKLDICEVDRACYDLLYNTTARYFLVVDDEHICFYASAEEYFKKTGECRWDLFCCTKQYCKDMIKSFSDAHDVIERHLSRAEKPAFKVLATIEADKVRARMIKTFGKTPL